jgi:hypothetical protein
MIVRAQGHEIGPHHGRSTSATRVSSTYPSWSRLITSSLTASLLPRDSRCEAGRENGASHAGS